MKKIAILRCLKTSASCAGAGCLRAFYEKDKAFAQYGDEELRLMAMWTCNGCGDSKLENQDGIRKKIERMKALELDALHISHCTHKRMPMAKSISVLKLKRLSMNCRKQVSPS